MALPDKRTIATGDHLRFVARGPWEWVERVKARCGVVIIAINADRRLILVQQFRVPINRPVIELPAGLVGDMAASSDEPLLEAARRELLEETGYEAAKMTHLFTGVLAPGLCDEHNEFFFAHGLRKVGPGGGDSGENITVHEVPLDSCALWLHEQHERGLAIDAKIFAALHFAQQFPSG
jgi:ADP-ribose pyrophosphatase